MSIPRQKGFTLVEGLLGIIVLTLITFVGIYTYNTINKKTDDTHTSSSTKSTNEQQVTKTADGLMEFCSKYEKACLQYPSDWSAESVANLPGGDGIQLISKHGSELSFVSAIAGLGGACSPERPNVIIDKVIAHKIVTSLYVVESHIDGDSEQQIGLKNADNDEIPKPGDSGTCLYYTVFDSRTRPTQTQIAFQGTFVAEDREMVEQILQTYRYQ